MPTALNTLRQTEGGFLGPRHNMRRSPRDGTQARGAGVFLDRTGQTTNLVVASVRASLRARHGGEAVYLEWTRLAPRSFLASFTSHATTVPRRNTRRTFSSLSTSTMSAFFPGESVPTVSSPRMAAPCADAM